MMSVIAQAEDEDCRRTAERRHSQGWFAESITHGIKLVGYNYFGCLLSEQNLRAYVTYGCDSV